MIDTVTYGLTQTLPGGPIVRPEEPDFTPAQLDDEATGPASRSGLIAGFISLGLLAAAGAYLGLAL